MSDIIKQLPDRLANQIAAGEVIQRPASVVKELLENAVDASATDITLIILDAGKELIQVIDNGKGMSPLDARMCFERHATSKIQDIQDLFTIKTMGFRGEAMASIAAVAQVELITKTIDQSIGTKICIEGSDVKLNEQVATIDGTNISVKNLFYNVPARRKFLKSNTAEYKHIVEEFIRVAMAYPAVSFKLINNNVEQYNLRAGSSKNRIVDVLGSRFEKHLVSVNETTDYITITGFVGKPEIAARTKGNQFFFINNRFIKSAYLNHALTSAYEGLITPEEHPFYVLYFEMDPTKVDVNVHPTKQEVKFEDERTIYTYLKSIITHVLAMFNIAPSLDFSLTPEIQQLQSLHEPINNNIIDKVSNSYLKNTFSQPNSAHFIDRSLQSDQWQQERNAFFDTLTAHNPPTTTSSYTNTLMGNDISNSELENTILRSKISSQQLPLLEDPIEEKINSDSLQWKDYIITTGKSGLMIINIYRAQERIVYDALLQSYLYGSGASQQMLYPEILELSPADAIILDTTLDDLRKMGFEISSMGTNAYAIHGIPSEMINMDIRDAIEEIIESFKFTDEKKIVKDVEKLLRIAAKKTAQKYTASKEANQALIGKLFACVQPEYTPSGEKVILVLSNEDVKNLL